MKRSIEERKALARQRPQLRIVSMEHDEQNLVVRRNGEIRHDVMVVVHEDDIGAVREGYYCQNCFDPQDEPMPETCVWCGFRMRDRQPEMLAKGWRGNVKVGPQATQDEEDAFMAEWALRKKRESRDPILRPTQIWLPGKDW